MISWIVTQHNSLGTLYEITPRWMPQNLGDDKSTLVQIMPFQATNHYRSQCIYLCCHMVSLGHIVLTTKAAKMDDNVSDFHMHIIFISYLGKYHQSPFEHSFSFSLYSIDSDGFAKQSYDVDYKWHCNGNVEYVYCGTDQGIFFPMIKLYIWQIQKCFLVWIDGMNTASCCSSKYSGGSSAISMGSSST